LTDATEAIPGEVPGELALDAATGATVTFTFATWGAVTVWLTLKPKPELDDVWAKADAEMRLKPAAAKRRLYLCMTNFLPLGGLYFGEPASAKSRRLTISTITILRYNLLSEEN